MLNIEDNFRIFYIYPDDQVGVFMPQLQIKEMPVDLYENISKTAEAENRDISQQVIILLQSALDLHRSRIDKLKPVFSEIDSLQIKNANAFPNPVELVREDRDR